jgi:hypothetical protein
MSYVLAVVLLVVGLASCSTGRVGLSGADAIAVTRLNAAYEVTIPVSRLTLIIPSAGLSRDQTPYGGATEHPEYFRFIDRKGGLYISGWFEPAERFRNVKKGWETDIRFWKQQGFPVPLNPSFSRIGRWDTITYDNVDRGVTISHIRAHWLQAGTWIDLHLSMGGFDRSTADLRAQLEGVLKGIEVKEKT